MATVLTEIEPSDSRHTASEAKSNAEQNRRSAGIADAERTIGEIRHRRAQGRRRDDRDPIEKGMELLRGDLGDHGDNEHAKKMPVPIK